MIKALLIFSALLSTEAKENYKVSTEESTVEWVGKKVTGQHNGVISLQGGRLEMEGGMLVGGIFTIDMTTITDLDLSRGSKGKLEGHLKSDDFFGVEKYPTSTFTITKAVPQGPGKYKIVGNITIKGKTEEIQFPATVEEKDGKIVASATLSIDRSKFDVRYGSGSFFDNLGDKTIYDNFDLSISLVASK
ncbi:YceI family protein [Ekhidna sp.]|uniref:YceI family protein n=1 Tax=Ekhidna sp. TaxID=2608089 RepID=UPI003297A016